MSTTSRPKNRENWILNPTKNKTGEDLMIKNNKFVQSGLKFVRATMLTLICLKVKKSTKPEFLASDKKTEFC